MIEYVCPDCGGGFKEYDKEKVGEEHFNTLFERIIFAMMGYRGVEVSERCINCGYEFERYWT